jgi:hypothetical protein
MRWWRGAPPAVRASFLLLVLALAASFASFAPSWLDTGGSVVALLLALAIGGALWLAVAFGVLRGRNWARLGITALSVLGLATSVGGMASGVFGPLDYLLTGAMVVAVVLLWVPASREFFRGRRDEPR